MSIALSPYGESSVVVNGATGTGTGSSLTFAVQTCAEGTGLNVTLQGILTGSFSAFKVNLEASLDGGTTWSVAQGGIDLYGSPMQQLSPALTPGAIYRLNVATFTGGTSAVVKASAS